MTNSKKDSELDEPTLREWLTLLQTNHDKSIDEQIANIDRVEQAITAKYISRKEIEEAIELLQQPVYSEEKEGVDGYMVYTHELRAKLLPPTKGGNDV